MGREAKAVGQQRRVRMSVIWSRCTMSDDEATTDRMKYVIDRKAQQILQLQGSREDRDVVRYDRSLWPSAVPVRWATNELPSSDQ